VKDDFYDPGKGLGFHRPGDVDGYVGSAGIPYGAGFGGAVFVCSGGRGQEVGAQTGYV
jgi:hypothetical protein